jgi:murein DD-endopeptidase MepM/ murein hydrolase activator NlpD
MGRPLRWCRITNPFGAPGSYASKANKYGPAGHHTGVDYGKHLLPLVEVDGKVVRAPFDGEVVISEYQRNHDGSSTMGNWVGLYNAKIDVTLTFWHMGARRVEVGESVKAGQVIGVVGSTGNSTAPHLHVQANRGRFFDYNGHIPPHPWLTGWTRQPRKPPSIK